MSQLDTTVFEVIDGQIVEGTLRDYLNLVDETTTPRGVAPRYHLRGTELWTWGYAGNFPRLVSEHDTEEEAQMELERAFVYDIQQSDKLLFQGREAAEKFLSDNQPESEP